MRTRRKFTIKFKSRVVLALVSGEYDLTAQMVND